MKLREIFFQNSEAVEIYVGTILIWKRPARGFHFPFSNVVDKRTIEFIKQV